MIKIVYIRFEILIFVFCFFKFEILSIKLHHLTLDSKSKLVNSG